MQITNGTLLQNPNQYFEISDDNDALFLLIELGLSAQFEQGVKESRTQLVIYDEHTTHWIAAVHLTGKTPPSENGYIVTCIPKSKCDRAGFSRFIQQSFGDSVAVEKMRPLSTKPNRN